MGTKVKIEVGKKYRFASGKTVLYLKRDPKYKLNYFKIGGLHVWRLSLGNIWGALRQSAFKYNNCRLCSGRGLIWILLQGPVHIKINKLRAIKYIDDGAQ